MIILTLLSLLQLSLWLCFTNIALGQINPSSTNPYFTGTFHIVKANVSNAAILGTFTNASQVLPPFGSDPISLYIDYEGTFKRVVFHYNMTSSSGTRRRRQVEFAPPYALGGNQLSLFYPVPYLQSKESKMINVKGYDWKSELVAEMELKFVISDVPIPAPVTSPIAAPSSSGSSPSTTERYECFYSNAVLKDAVRGYVGLPGLPKADAEARYGPINSWCVDYVEDFTDVFAISTYEIPSLNLDVGNWNTSSAKKMSNMFGSFGGSFNQDLSKWDVSRVTEMDQMFFGQTYFNQDLSRWNVSRVTSMYRMFEYSGFNGDISTWDVRSVKTMAYMFFKASAFNQDISKWNVSGVADASLMFYEAYSFNTSLCAWGPTLSQSANVIWMFYNAYSCPEMYGTPNLFTSPRGPFCHAC